jgi:hypothetical protein
MLDWLGWLLAPGVFGGLIWLGYRLHRDAVDAHRGRADDARARAEAAEKRADLHWEQIGILLGRKEPQ